VALAPLLASGLQGHRGRAGSAASEWVFPSGDGCLLPKCVLRRPLERACELAGVGKRLTTHGLWRTFNNLSHQLNGEIVTRSMTGHVTAAMTEHYSHVGADEKLAAVTRIAEVVSLSDDRSGGSGGGSSETKNRLVTGAPQLDEISGAVGENRTPTALLPSEPETCSTDLRTEDR
jgi:hypothetical protein